MYRYFIFFNFILKNGSGGIGNMETNVNFKISGINDVKKIEKSILDENEDYMQVLINNFIRLE